MAKKNKEGSGPSELSDIGSIQITKEHIKMIESIIHSMDRIKLDKEALAEDVKAVAAKMNLKPGAVTEIASWIQKEQQKGGVLDEKEKKIELVRKVLSSLDGEG